MRRLLFRSGALGGALALVAGAAPARAEPLPHLAVHRTADVGDCPDAATLAAAVAKQMKRPAVEPVAEIRRTTGPSGAAATAGVAGLDVQLYRSAEGYTAVITAAGKTRTIADRGATCAGLGDALAITLAILLDTEGPAILAAQGPETAVRPAPREEVWPSGEPPPADSSARGGSGSGEEPGGAPSSTRSSLPGLERSSPYPGSPPAFWSTAPPVAPRPPPPAPVQSPFGQVSLEAGVLGTAGILGSVAFGAAASATLRLSRGTTLAAGGFWLPAETIAFAPGTVRVDLAGGFLRGCGLVLGRPSAAHGSLCLHPAVGAIHGQGSGYATNGTSTQPWIALGADLEGAGPLWGPLGWVARAGVLVPLERQGFSVTAVGTAFDPSAAGGVVEGGLRVTIW
jgi:hypothetical protein